MADANPISTHWRFQDLTGKRFVRWPVKGFAGRRNKRLLWHVVCDCGTESAVMGATLADGNSKSCGCLKSEAAKARPTTHGRSGTPEYRAWAHVIDRCCNPDCNNYQNYGGRG